MHWFAKPTHEPIWIYPMNSGKQPRKYAGKNSANKRQKSSAVEDSAAYSSELYWSKILNRWPFPWSLCNDATLIVLDDRYTSEDGYHQWYFSFDVLEPIFSKTFSDTAHLLEIGCGDSPLLTGLRSSGHKGMAIMYPVEKCQLYPRQTSPQGYLKRLTLHRSECRFREVSVALLPSIKWDAFA